MQPLPSQTSLCHFRALLKLFNNKGIVISKMVYNNISHEATMLSLLRLLYLNDMSHSCFDTATFLTALFVDDYHLSYKLDSVDLINQFPKHKTPEEFDQLFKPMTFTRINDITHDFSIIYISDNEIYLIDYYYETGRENFFRVKKYNYMEIHTLILAALFSVEEGPQAYKTLFDFKNDSYIDLYMDMDTGERHSMKGVRFWSFKIKTLPTIEKLIRLWDISSDMYIKQYNEELQSVDYNTFKILWSTRLSDEEKAYVPEELWYDNTYNGYGYLFSDTLLTPMTKQIEDYNNLLSQGCTFSADEILKLMNNAKKHILNKYREYVTDMC